VTGYESEIARAAFVVFLLLGDLLQITPQILKLGMIYFLVQDNLIPESISFGSGA